MQTEITALEAQISVTPQFLSTGSDGTNFVNQRYVDLTTRLDKLYQQLDRTTGAAPMLSRGRVVGLGRA